MIVPPETGVRLATADDVDALSWLDQMCRSGLHDARGGAAWLAETPEVDWSAALQAADEMVHVGLIDDVVVAFIHAVVDSRRVTVRQVFVHPEARELGLGDGLLESVAERARHRACVVIEGTALPGDRDTKNLYERAGITARKIVVSKPL